MKNKLVALILVAVVCGIVIIVIFEVVTANTIKKYQSGASDITSISFFIEDYKHAHGEYPSSLVELASNEDDVQIKSRVCQLLSNKFNGDYEYSSLSNGFEITKGGNKYRYEATEEGFMIIGRFGTNFVAFKSGMRQ